MLLCKNRGLSGFCGPWVERRNWQVVLHPLGDKYMFLNGVVANISLQACWLCCCFHQFTKLVLPVWCLHVPNAVALSFPMIDGQVEWIVGVVHFFRTVTSEFLVIIIWTTFAVCCLSGRIKCSWITTKLYVRWSASGFLSPNWPERNSKPASALGSSFAAWGLLPFASSKTSCFFLERRTSLDLKNSRSLRMLILELSSFRYRWRRL